MSLQPLTPSPQAQALPGAGEAVVTLRGASKSYGSIRALLPTELSLHAGEVLALLGPNGAGKTTTIQLMLGLIRPDQGEVRVFGKDPSVAENRIRTGAMMQGVQLPSTLKVRELVELFSSYYPSPLPLKQVLDMAELGGLEDRLCRALSEGQRQRVRFALAICGNPDLIFLDEPSVGLDVASRRSFWEQIRQFAAQKRTLLLTTHYVEEADALADRVALLHQGKLGHIGTPQQLKARLGRQHVACQTRLSPEELSAIPGVQEVRRQGALMELSVSADIPIARELYQRDPDLKDLTVRPAALEEVLLPFFQQGRSS